MAEVKIAIDDHTLDGILSIPNEATRMVVFAHGSGSSRLSPRNSHVAEVLNAAGIATLLFDLLTIQEERDVANVFNVELLAKRILNGLHWVQSQPVLGTLPIGLFGASTGAAAALIASTDTPIEISAIVSRGGRPDLAGYLLERVPAPTLLIVGEKDVEVLVLNQVAAERLTCEHELVVIPGATHLFEESGTLDLAANAARDWFLAH